MSQAYAIVDQFEQEIARYAGADFAVAVSSCTNAIFLCCKYLQVDLAGIPKRTYPGVACSIIHAGGKITFSNNNKLWSGIYELWPWKIYDSALRFRRNMYIKKSLYCLSFHAKKQLPIGRGGMILTDDITAYSWLKRARFDGRNAKPLNEDKFVILGWNMYMTPEQAARGLMLFDMIKHKNLPDLKVKEQDYPDLSKWGIYRK